MAKTILIFSDGTGQVGGLRPDQRLSNVYKMYRAMRPGPDSLIRPDDQYAFYDPGLGAGEVGGLTFKRTRAMLAAAVGTGNDENVIDCYSAIIANYQAGERICLFGFSRGAYTVRALTNVLNLCGCRPARAMGVPSPGTARSCARLRATDGSSMALDNMPATDLSGYARVEDRVDFHTWRLLKGVALSTLLGVGTELSLGSGESYLVGPVRESTQQNATRAGDQITQRNLGVQPTLTVRPGWPLCAVIHKDLVLRPWKE